MYMAGSAGLSPYAPITYVPTWCMPPPTTGTTARPWPLLPNVEPNVWRVRPAGPPGAWPPGRRPSTPGPTSHSPAWPPFVMGANLDRLGHVRRCDLSAPDQRPPPPRLGRSLSKHATSPGDLTTELLPWWILPYLHKLLAQLPGV